MKQNFFQHREYDTNPLFDNVIMGFTFATLFLFLAYRIFYFVEAFWMEYVQPRPLFRHFYLWKQKLSRKQLRILENEFPFYNRLDKKEQTYFEHRVVQFIKRHAFKDMSGVSIDDEKRILISATAVMLTFGYRNYRISSVKRFLIYPEPFFSRINNTYHIGEFNPAYKAIVLSWKDFLHGFDVRGNNHNLGIHEYVHAIHFHFLTKRHENLSSAIFENAYNDLFDFLRSDQAYHGNKLVASRYLRDYAYTNKFEFIAVLVEAFMESPEELKAKFPQVYSYVKEMLNFNFKGY